jgi:hypothetical protein
MGAADRVAALFQPAMIAFDDGLAAFDHAGGRIGEEAGDLLMQGGPIGREGCVALMEARI